MLFSVVHHRAEMLFSVVHHRAEVFACGSRCLCVGTWLCVTVVERRSLTGELSLSCARMTADHLCG